MLRVFTIDGTEGMLYYEIVKKYVSESNHRVETSMDRAVARIPREVFDLFVISKCPGKADLYDVAEVIKASRLNNRAEIIMMVDNPTLMSKLTNLLRGRKVYNLKSNHLEQLDDLLERMSS